MISLASDTETRPTPAMREAMARADVGDEQRGEDPTVNRLQDRVAELLGKEAALWMPTGTFCNLVSVKVHTQPGDVVLADAMAHVIRAESAGAAVASGVLIEPISSARGVFDVEALRAALERVQTLPSPYSPRPKLVCLEQSHNFGGGAVWPVETLESVANHAKARGLAVHIDGARFLNACLAADVMPARMAASADSVWLDFTKGLGAPIGAVLAGSKGFIAEARRFKHVFGGAMRQAGIAAAGCLHALDHHVDRLADDHANASLLSDGLARLPGVTLRSAVPETNMVFFEISGAHSNASFLQGLGARGVRMGQVRGAIRAVTHLDVSRKDVETALAACAEVLQQPPPR